MIEVRNGRYFQDGTKIEHGPEFSRLPSHAKLAMVQEIRSTIKTKLQIHNEAVERISRGERVPPDSINPFETNTVAEDVN